MSQSIADALVKASKSHFSGKLSPTDRQFIQDYYHRLPRDDFEERSVEELINSALRHRQLAEVRKADETRVEIYRLKIVDEASDELSSEQGGELTVLSVVSDDKPFLLDTLAILLTQKGLRIHRMIHPIFRVKRSKNHQLKSMLRYRSDDTEDQGKGESFIQYHFDVTSDEQQAQLLEAVNQTLAEVDYVVSDWSGMRGKLLSQALRLESQAGVNGEYGQLLRWLENHHFTLLGCCEFDLNDGPVRSQIEVDLPSTQGFLRHWSELDAERIGDLLPPLICNDDKPFIITKSKLRSGIHRSSFMDCIILRLNGQKGSNKQQRGICFLGLFTAASFVRPTNEIPLLGEKTQWILDNSALRKASYAYKTLRVILETLPRELLFQMGRERIYATAIEILDHQERRKTNVYIHQDQCGHFYSCLVYVPRELFHSDLRIKIQQYLADVLDADEVLFDVHFSDSVLMRIHFVIHTRDGVPVDYDEAAIQQVIRVMARDWNEGLRFSLERQNKRSHVAQLMAQYTNAFSNSYRDDFNLREAIKDIQEMALLESCSIRSLLYVSEKDEGQSSRLKVFSHGKPIALSDILPIMENVGLRVLGERPYRIRRQADEHVWIHDFELARQDGKPLDIQADGKQLRETLLRVWQGEADNDGFNRLVLDTGLDWRQIVLLRACYKYLRQIRLRYSQEYVIDALVMNRNIAVLLCDLFKKRLDPTEASHETEQIESALSEALEQVDSLDEDRILCAIRDVISAMLRCNYFQFDDAEAKIAKPYLSFKIDSRAIPRMPEPRPKYEIFVYSPRVEGVHLRGGDVARGGLRWSDRLEDYRTEVLGLVKAQMVKNAVIVPVGSKGGFVPKQLPVGPDADRDAVQAEAIACYQLFISGLLDLTDSISGTDIVPAQQVVRHDGDDPYLVVAADKGTATFSDIANAISESRDFWLGDAFASGGSMGYDHKKMGITARGAWESVKRHFRELGKDIQSSPFTALGIGDMAGDVFGNGMLLSKQTCLLAAFNHLHIFIDPKPNPETSHVERQRLFDLPRSAWTDYDASLISTGGGGV